MLQKQTDDDFSDNDSAIDTEENLQFTNYEHDSTQAAAHDLSGISLNVLNENYNVKVRLSSMHSFFSPFSPFGRLSNFLVFQQSCIIVNIQCLIFSNFKQF